MHGMDDQVDMRRFGHLSGAMKVTWVTFGVGWLAILGVFPFAGFWSKDKIIEAAFIGEGWRPWVFGFAALIGAGITAFYMSRLFFMTFHGSKRWTKDVHPHESPKLMTIPMIVLAFGSAFVGLILGPTNIFTHWLEPVVGARGAPGARGPGDHHAHAGPRGRRRGPGLDALLACGPRGGPGRLAADAGGRRDLYQDEVNEGVFMRPGIHLTRSLVFADNRGVDGAVGGMAALVGGTSSRLRRVQNGFARSYALTMLIGVVAIFAAVWVIQ